MVWREEMEDVREDEAARAAVGITIGADSSPGTGSKGGCQQHKPLTDSACESSPS